MEIKGYKVFNPSWTCRGFQYEVGQTYEENITPKVHSKGFHFCERAVDCFNCYSFNSKNKVAEVIALGDIDTDGIESCTNKLEIVREVSWEEVLKLVNTGDRNSGNRNSGNRNSGNRNSGGCNSGAWNSGDYNSGNCNSGKCNSGNCNSGAWNSGDYNSGNCNSGDYNSGNCSSGACNSGDYNSGNRNSGNWNSGNYNSGNCNSGDCNSGDWNSGDYNSGKRNIGNRNSGNWNRGNYNSGDWNKTNYSNGCFNTKTQYICMFDKQSNWTRKDWLKSETREILAEVPRDYLAFISLHNMTQEEIEAYPEAKVTGGYLRAVKGESRQEWWNKLHESKKEIIKSLPNFDSEIFKEIIGIDVTKGDE